MQFNNKYKQLMNTSMHRLQVLAQTFVFFFFVLELAGCIKEKSGAKAALEVGTAFFCLF